MIDSDNGLSSDRRQAIIWTNAGLLLIGTLGVNVSEISLAKMHLKISSSKNLHQNIFIKMAAILC